MSIRKTNWLASLIFSLLWLGGFAVCGASAEEVRIVVPSELENEEGDSESGSATAAGMPWRTQTLYLASEFASLPLTHRTITGFFFRPDSRITEPRNVDFADVRMQVSTTTAGLGELDTVFANNVGGDVVTLYQGPLTVTTQAMGPPQGPRDFDYFFPFQTPFHYDPSAGRNILFDFKTESGYDTAPIFDAYFVAANETRVIVGDANAPEGVELGIASVSQIVFVPEPSTLLMGALGLVLVGLAGLSMRSRLPVFDPFPESAKR